MSDLILDTGYLITDEELVVTRIVPAPEYESHSEMEIQKHRDPSDSTPAYRARRSGILEYKAIPWDNHKDPASGNADILTVNLALWWLHIMVGLP